MNRQRNTPRFKQKEEESDHPWKQIFYAPGSDRFYALVGTTSLGDFDSAEAARDARRAYIAAHPEPASPLTLTPDLYYERTLADAR